LQSLNSPKSLFFIISVLLLNAVSCVKNNGGEPQDKMLVRIGDKIITVDEFKYRTEFTVMPISPGQSSENLKKTCLNNLIIEKLFSLEAGDSNKMVQNKSFQALIKGIKEQSMREQLYYLVAYNKVKLDTSTVKKVYYLAGLEYDLEFFMIPNSQLAQKIQSAGKSNPDSIKIIFSRLYQSTDRSFKQTVKYRDPEPQAIHEALFSELLSPDTIIGPLQIEEDSYIVMKIVNWKYIPAIGGEDVQTRWSQVSQKMKQNKADHLWREYSQKIMKGKTIIFKKAIFNKLAGLFLSIRQAMDEKDQATIYKPFRQNEEGILIAKAMNDMESIMDTPFFSIDDKIWTVRDFRNELLSHPLVYRKQDIDTKSFNKQFTYAIADLARDHYLTKEAYKKSLDKDPKVKRTSEMWKDSYIAFNFRNELLQAAIKNGKIDSSNNLEKNRYFNDAIKHLEKKYGHRITIDNKEMKNITMTNVNMLVTQPNVPYPVVVPGFPQLTSDYQLDYVGNFLN
jgi:hypothetical protein